MREGIPGFREILSKAQDGDRAAMDEAIAILHPYVEPVARRYADPGRPAESTSDLIQKSCLRAWEKIGAFDGGKGDEETLAMFRVWMGQIIRRLGIETYRKRAARAALSGDPAAASLPEGAASPGAPAEPISPQSGPPTQTLSAERSRQIEEALGGLPEPVDAQIIRMHFFDGLAFNEIAASLDLPFGDVRRRYRATMRDLQRQMRARP